MIEVVGIICGTIAFLAGLLAILVVLAQDKLAKQPSINDVFAQARKIIEEVEAGK